MVQLVNCFNYAYVYDIKFKHLIHRESCDYGRTSCLISLWHNNDIFDEMLEATMFYMISLVLIPVETFLFWQLAL